MRRTLLAFLALAVSAPAPAVASDTSRTLSYAVEWGPVPLAEVRFALTTAGPLTQFDAHAWSTGAADVFSSFEMRQSVRYSFPEKRVYVSAGSFGGDPKVRIVGWEGAEVVRTDVPPPEEELTPIPAGETVGTVDPAFPWLDTLARLDGGESCDATYRVYDGTRRMDITLSGLREEVLEADRGWTYAGPAVACRLTFRRIGGFSIDREVEEQDYERVIWFARIDGAFAPVRLRVEWPLGYATARIDLR